MNKHFFIIFVTFLFSYLVSFSLFAKSNNECLNLHVIKNSPLGFIDKSKKLRGVHADYLRAIAKDSGVCIENQLFPYPRIWESIKKGGHDGGIIFKSASRSTNIKYVALIRTVKTIVIPAKGKVVDSYNDLKTLKIGKTKGTHLSKTFDNDPELQLVEVTNYAQAIKMLKSGRIDAVAGSALVLSYQFNRHDALDAVDLSNRFILGEKEQWLQLAEHATSEDVSKALKDSIERLKHQGVLDAIMDKYYGKQWREINN